MKKYSIRSLAAVTITALLLAILALPVASGSAGPTTATKSGNAISAAGKGPIAAYTKKRAKRVIRRKRIVRRKKVVRRKRIVRKIAPLAIAAAPAAVAAAPVNDQALAQALLDGYKAQYPRYLGGATVEFGNAMGYQAISYYTIGRIVISPTHSASVQVIVAHEIWHIIDWQDNNAIDWGESIPPTNYATFAN
jgi:hypothetical protein